MTPTEFKNLKAGAKIVVNRKELDFTNGKYYIVKKYRDDDLFIFDDAGSARFLNIGNKYEWFDIIPKKPTQSFSKLPKGTTEIVIDGVRYKKVTKTVTTTKWEIA